MRRACACICLVGLVMWLGESTAMAQGATQNQTTQSTRNTTTPGTAPAGTSASPAGTAPGGTNLNQATGAQPNLQSFGTGFVGGSQNQGRVVGSQFAGQQQSGGGGTGINMFGGGRGGAGGGGGRFAMPNQASRNRGSTRRVRPQLRVAFSFQSRSITTIKTSLDTRFSMLLASRPQFKGVTISVGKKGELMLAGEVPNSAARRMAAAMVRMEPGVRKVTNQLTVAAVEPTGG
jgi:hypothetical protein